MFTTTQGNQMTESQKQGMIKFHLKAAKAFRQFGQTKNAEQAEAAAKKLQERA